jgi:hypothetical protein
VALDDVAVAPPSISPPPIQQTHRVEAVFDDSAVYKVNVPAFADEVCNHHTFPEGAHLFDLTCHTHKRGKRFRVFLGKFACDGGPHANEPCSPFGPEESLLYTSYVYNDPLQLTLEHRCCLAGSARRPRIAR